ncbi:MAG: SRPBCC family protein [Bacteroidota bacterium]
METVSMHPEVAVPQAKRYKELVETKTSRVIKVSAERLWEIVGAGFADAHVWSSGLDHSEGSGEPRFEGAVCNERYCEVNVKGFNKISETLVEYDDFQRTLTYVAHSGLPGFVIHAQNTWRIISVSPNESRFEMRIVMRLKPLMGMLAGGAFRKNLNKTIDGVIDDLSIYAETGRISAAKQARLDYLARKKK